MSLPNRFLSSTPKMEFESDGAGWYYGDGAVKVVAEV